MHGLEKNSDLFYSLYPDPNIHVAQKERSRYRQFTKANEMAQKIGANPSLTEQLAVELIDSGNLSYVDLILACLCADGEIKGFSTKLTR
jgi:hypothetical protein